MTGNARFATVPAFVGETRGAAVRRRAVCCLAVLLPLLAAGCASDDEQMPSQAFPPLRYDYLKPLDLNVAEIEVKSDFVPAPGGPAALSPVSPLAVLEQMAHDRLRADGSSGKALFTVEDASVVLVPGGLSGSMAVRLDVLTGDGTRAGYAEARVSQIYAGPTGDIRTVTYNLVKQMMDRMNVEFEFQIRRTLRDWLQEAGTAPPPAPVQQQDLGPPGGVAVPPTITSP